MARRGRVGRSLRVPLLTVVLLMAGIPEADAAYRLTFQNGTSLEVQSYEDLGEAIRYQRYGGTVTVPKAHVTAIQEVHSAPPALTPPGTPPRLAPVPSPTSPRSPPPAVAPAARMAPPGAARGAPVRSNHAQPVGQFGLVAGAVSIIGGVAPLLLVLAGLALVFRLLAGAVRAEADLPYEQAGPLVTPAERSFYGVLSHAVDSRYPIFAKVRLGDLLTVPRGTLKIRSYRNRIDRKHVDFVLCAPDDLTPLLVIELDDGSHARRDRRERDAFVDAALGAAGLPILHVPAQHAYAPAELRTLIDDQLLPERWGVIQL
jgi:Protein of unknown function (DUF2726)